MAILDIDGQYENEEEFQEQRVFRTQEEMKTSTLFNKERPLDTIIRYPKGSKWEVSYFLQLRDQNDTIELLDINIPLANQKYNRINKLILYLQSGINQDNIEAITGECIINAGFLPNAKDLFLAELPGGRQALFSITEVQNRTYNIHYAYYCQFKLFYFVDTDSVIYNDLLRKTMKEYTYDKGHLLDYSAPIILSSDYKKKLDLKKVEPEIIDHYFRYFINFEKNVIALPTKASVYVDTLLNDFINKILNTNDNEYITKLTNLELDFQNKIPYSIWDIIIKRDKNLLKRVITNIGFKYRPFGTDAMITRKMNYLGVHFIADRLDRNEKPATPDINNIALETTNELTYPIDRENRSYVLSESFYNLDLEKVGLLEQLLLDYLDSKIIDVNKLDTLIEQYPYWDTIDQYYLLPILLVLVRDASSHTFKSL